MSQDQNEEGKKKKITSSEELGDEELKGLSGGEITGSIHYLGSDLKEELGRLDADTSASIAKFKR